jgi:predicted RNA-binding protein YlqC (UPF0109 family)
MMVDCAAEPREEGPMKDLIEEVAKALVDNADGVSVREVTGATTTVYELSVDKSDIGKIIGKSGRTLRALRTILGAVGSKINRKVILEILE